MTDSQDTSDRQNPVGRLGKVPRLGGDTELLRARSRVRSLWPHFLAFFPICRRSAPPPALMRYSRSHDIGVLRRPGGFAGVGVG